MATEKTLLTGPSCRGKLHGLNADLIANECSGCALQQLLECPLDSIQYTLSYNMYRPGSNYIKMLELRLSNQVEPMDPMEQSQKGKLSEVYLKHLLAHVWYDYRTIIYYACPKSFELLLIPLQAFTDACTLTKVWFCAPS